MFANIRLTNCVLIILLRRRSHIRPQWLILFHQCSSTTFSSKNDPLETNLKPPPMKLFQNTIRKSYNNELEFFM